MTPCPYCDQAAVTDEDGCCIHCGAVRGDQSGAPAQLEAAGAWRYGAWWPGVLTVGELRRQLASVSDDVLVTIGQPEPGGWYWHCVIENVPDEDPESDATQPTVILRVTGDFDARDL